MIAKGGLLLGMTVVVSVNTYIIDRVSFSVYTRIERTTPSAVATNCCLISRTACGAGFGTSCVLSVLLMEDNVEWFEPHVAASRGVTGDLQ